MKTTKLIIVISELWNDNQRSCVRNCLLRGIEEINKKVDINDLIEELNAKDVNKEIELESCIVHTMIDVDKDSFLLALKGNQFYERLLIVYVGPVSAPWGQWLLCDCIVSSLDVVQLIDNAKCKLVMATLAPCDDWLTTEKKYGDSVIVCSYDLTECADPIALGLSDFVDSICRSIKVTRCGIKKPDTSTFLKVAHPSVCGFLDKGSSTMPCLFLIDGFSMLFNVGYGRNPEMRHHLSHMAQVDAALLSHVSYNNVLPLSCTSQHSTALKINHLFVPCGVSVTDKATGANGTADSENPYIVDLNNELAKILSGYKSKGTSISQVFIKGKSGTPVVHTQLKPIPLFQKIGYGTLELIALAPFEDDSDVKKCMEDLKKGKYVNDCQGRPLPSSVSVLLLWKPFNPRMATKRVLYIGPRSQLRKNLPAVITALYSNNDCLKHAEYIPLDAINKRPASRKTVTKKASANTADGTTEPIKKIVVVDPSTGKTAKSLSSNDSAKKAGTASSANKLTRPFSATASANFTRAKESEGTKRPNSGTSSKTRSDGSSKTADLKRPLQKTAGPKSATGTVTKEEQSNHVKEQLSDSGSIVNGDKRHCDNETVNESVTQDGGDQVPEQGKIVAIGTVECAITEHGEADFCDDSPEELSAEQMKELGLYDDEEGRSSAVLSDGNEMNGDDIVSGGIAHLPMEGSFYGKDSFEDKGAVPLHWQPPLGLPVPARDGTSGSKKACVTKCATPVHVDCVCVPADIDKEDLRCLFSNVRFVTALVQLERCTDLGQCLEVLMEEWGPQGTGRTVTVVPSIDDEVSRAWLKANEMRLHSANIAVTEALTRCSITIDSEDNEHCLGYRCDL